MRRSLLALVIVALLVPQAHASGGKLGLQVAGVSNQLTGELPAEGSWAGRYGLGGSLVFELDLAPDISLSLQPGYTPRDSRQEFKRNSTVVSFTDYQLGYLTIPLLVRVTGDPVGVRGFVTAGIELGLLLDAKVDDGTGGVDVTDDFEQSSFNALFGAGAMVPLGRQFLTFELRYVQGLSDIVRRDGDVNIPGTVAPSVKHRSFELLVGYLLPLGRP